MTLKPFCLVYYGNYKLVNDLVIGNTVLLQVGLFSLVWHPKRLECWRQSLLAVH